MAKKINQQKLNQGISDMVSLMKTTINNTLIEKSTNLNLDKKQLMHISNLIDASITKVFVNSLESITHQVNEK